MISSTLFECFKFNVGLIISWNDGFFKFFLGHTERSLRIRVTDETEIPDPKISLQPGVYVCDQTVTRPRKRLYNEMVNGLPDSPFLFQPDSFLFTWFICDSNPE